MTGAGTIDDPILVGSYEEIKEGLNTGQYVKLVNDIDCNDYGASFKWQTIGLPGTRTEAKYLDLDGHTIKNVVIPENNYMFNFNVGVQAGFELYNGEILNVFCESANGIFDAKSLSTWHDLSFSIEGTSAKKTLFSNVNLERCSIDLEASKMPPGLSSNVFTDCDLYFDITDMNNLTLTNNASATNSRIKGTIGGALLTMSGKHYLWGYSGSLSNCIVEFDVSNLTCNINTVCNLTNTVVNLGDKYIGTTGSKATAEQIRDPAYNNSVGFTVVEVTE